MPSYIAIGVLYLVTPKQSQNPSMLVVLLCMVVHVFVYLQKSANYFVMHASLGELISYCSKFQARSKDVLHVHT